MPQNPAALLRALVALSGLPANHYARQRLGRPPSTLYAWMNGERPVPPVVLRFLESQPEYAAALEVVAPSFSEVLETREATPSAPRSA